MAISSGGNSKILIMPRLAISSKSLLIQSKSSKSLTPPTTSPPTS